MSRKIIALGLCVSAVLTLPAIALAHVGQSYSPARVVRPARFARSMPLRDMRYPNLPPLLRQVIGDNTFSEQQIAQLRDKLIKGGLLQPAGTHVVLPLGRKKPALSTLRRVHDPAVQTAMPRTVEPNDFTTPGLSFDGLGKSTGTSSGSTPPDTNIAVGLNYVVETVNVEFGVYNKSDGTLAMPVVNIANLWAAVGGDCLNDNTSDPIVNYDQFAHRWLISQITVNGKSGNYHCVAISQTGDPTGSYYVYAYPVSQGLPDYPKMGVWPGSYLATFNDFNSSGAFDGVDFVAYDSTAMQNGDPNASMVEFNETNNVYSDLPVEVDGSNMPPAGAPGLFVNYISPNLYGAKAPYALEIWSLSVDWSNPSGASLTDAAQLDVDPFTDLLCNDSRTCIPQASSSQTLDAVSDRLMYRAVYRNFGGHQAIAAMQNVGANSSGNPPAAERWYELRAPSASTSPTAWSVYQQGTYAPADGNSRWMGSIAFDHIGDIAMGYSVSGPSQDPEIAYTGRLATDPLGQMTQSETVLQAAGGADTGSYARWGDYTSMRIDPSDDCTFWYANQYWASPGSSFSWSTHIGSMKFANCTQGATGTLQGTVTDASTGKPLSGATIAVGTSPDQVKTKTDSKGNYVLKMPVGAYKDAALDFGYAKQSFSVSVANGSTTTQDFSLNKKPSATISGDVTDGSGHGYGLYSEVKVSTPAFGQVADVWTNPKDGSYSVNLPEGNDYTLDVTSYLDGYSPDTVTVTNLQADVKQNISLGVTAACTAPGYQAVQGFGQDFNGSTFPPTGWSVTDAVSGSPIKWITNTADFGRPNFTGGTGTSATVEPFYPVFFFGYHGPYDTSLVSPSIPLTGLGAEPLLHFLVNYQKQSGNTALDVDISTDGGNTWTNIAHITTNIGAFYAAPGETYSIDLTPYISGATSMKIRWRYYNYNGNWDWYAQIDNVSLGACKPVAGGLVIGSVADANTTKGLVGADISDDTGADTKSFDNAGDANLAVGYYLLFSKSGNRVITASMHNYVNATANVSVANNSVNVENFLLNAGMIKATPTELNVHGMVNTKTDETLALSNPGKADAYYKIYAVTGQPPEGLGSIGASLQEIKCKTALSPLGLRGTTQPPDCSGGDGGDTLNSVSASGWTSIPNFPFSTFDNCAATSGSSGDPVYVVGGIDNTTQTYLNTLFSYDPIAETYTQLPNAPRALERPACAVIAGKLYVTNGWDNLGPPWVSSQLAIYDPSSGKWSTGAPNPASLGGGSVAVALKGKMYVIGGCTASTCGFKTVEVYDPATNSWSSAAPYPIAISWQSCGAINGKIYCAGGAGPTAPFGTYAYDPGTNTWSGPLARIPVPEGSLWGAAFISTADGQLLIQGGIKNLGTTITNSGFAYDPVSDSWRTLPNALYAAMRVAGACGFYQFGGLTSSQFSSGLAAAEVLPGYSQCVPEPIQWMTLSSESGTVAAGTSADINVGLDGTGHTEFTTSQAYLRLTGDTPYSAQYIPVNVTWDPQPIHLILTGTASPNPVQKGGNLVYSLTVENQQLQGHGAATETTVSYPLPAGVSYVVANGDASCTAPPSGSGSAPSPGTVTCAFGTIDLGASKSETIAVKVADAGKLTSTFNVSAREPDSDPSTNTLSINTTVTGTADLSASSTNTTIPTGTSGEIHMVVSNAGPDTATDVVFKVTSGEDVNLMAGQWSMNAGGVSATGDCSLVSGVNGLDCDLADMPSGATADIVLDGFGAYVGTATVLGQVTTSANDPNPSNSVTTATVTVESPGRPGRGNASSGGGAALGWLALAALFGLAFAGAWTKSRQN